MKWFVYIHIRINIKINEKVSYNWAYNQVNRLSRPFDFLVTEFQIKDDKHLV